MIYILFSSLSLICLFVSLLSVSVLLKSSLKFTRGEIQRIVDNFIWGTIFMFGAIVSQFQVEFFNLARTPIDFIKYVFMLSALTLYFIASYEIYRLSKVFGFASEEIPEKLKKILKS
ncbi:MAG: hypothetical protein QXX38_01835 [Candidatus Aenigmatarchaeota archaeon]